MSNDDPVRRTICAVRGVTLALGLFVAALAGASEQSGVLSNGRLAVTLSNTGRVGNAFANINMPSCEYPVDSNTEHLYLGGVWVGARVAGGYNRVSVSACDANGLVESNTSREFTDSSEAGGIPSYRAMSNDPLASDFDPQAVAPVQVECRFDDLTSTAPGHVPLGLQVNLRALAWGESVFDDFIILEYTVTNVSAQVMSDVYVGFFNDTTVGNTVFKSPYDPLAVHRWDYWDDVNGAWRPGDFASDPSLWMMHEHDEDGDAGWATSWVGCRLLGTDPPVAARPGLPSVAYNSWRFRGIPEQDDYYWDPWAPTVLRPGKYQFLSNGQFDSGVTSDGDFSTASNWVGLLSTGPFPTLAPGGSLKVVFALALGADAAQLRQNSFLARRLYESGYAVPVAGVRDSDDAGAVLNPAVPNPFNPSTTVSFDLPEAGLVRLSVFDVAGRLVRTLVDEMVPHGRHEAVWDGRDASGREVASGSYLARLQFGGKVETVRMGLIR